jgi:hypothetical protein
MEPVMATATRDVAAGAGRYRHAKVVREGAIDKK